MKKICCVLFLLMALSLSTFAEADEQAIGSVPESLFVNQINNVLFSPNEPIVEIEGQYYLPVSPQFLSSLGLIPMWNEEGSVLNLIGHTIENRDINLNTEDPYLVDYERRIHIDVSSPVTIHLEVNDKTLELESNYLKQDAMIWYMPLTTELVELMNWELYDLGAYGQFLFFYDFTEEDRVDFMTYQARLNAMAKYMTIINKRLDIDRAAYYVQLVLKTSQKYDVEDTWILSIMWQESWYDESCTYINAVGMMQMLKSTGKSMGVTPEQLLNPAINIEVCVKYLTRDRAHYDGDLEKAIHAYNQGSFRVDKGTHKTWYFEEVQEKYGKIDAYIQKKVASL